MFRLVFTAQARRDAKKIATTPLWKTAESLLQFIAVDPFGFPPPFEALTGDWKGAFSRRINRYHRLVY